MKKVVKSLSLKKETVTALSSKEQNHLRGGNTLQVCGVTRTMANYYTSDCGPVCHEV